jgi:hypothetical protein
LTGGAPITPDLDSAAGCLPGPRVLERLIEPALTSDVEAIVAGVSHDAVFCQGLRHLIDAAMAQLPAPAEGT